VAGQGGLASSFFDASRRRGRSPGESTEGEPQRKLGTAGWAPSWSDWAPAGSKGRARLGEGWPAKSGVFTKFEDGPGCFRKFLGKRGAGLRSGNRWR